MRATWGWCVALGILVSWPAGAGGAPPLSDRPAGAAARPIVEEVDFDEGDLVTDLSTLLVRAIDEQGQPLEGLAPGDLRVEIAEREIPVKAIAWHDGREAAKPGSPLRHGQLVAVFVQADLETVHITGGRRLLSRLPELLGALRPEDRVAVFSFDSHLKLWLDFTRDRAAAAQAIARAMRSGGEPGPVGAAEEPAVAAYFDAAEARAAARPEEGLRLMAEALEPLPGEKMVLYVGSGLGHFGVGAGANPTPGYHAALEALKDARAHVFSLDVTPVESPPLELRVTGLARTLAGYYEITLDADALPAQGGELSVSLRGKKGSLLMATFAARFDE